MTSVGAVSRTARHARIAEILRARPVSSQTELAEALAGEGIGVAIATLSRDLDELGAVKLRAADGHMNGATYREIAIAIYGAARVDTEPWRTSPLRDAVIAFVEGGLALIDGGYLQLLRHRRRS